MAGGVFKFINMNITFETAKLAHEKGFRNIGDTAYSLSGEKSISRDSSFYDSRKYPINDCLQYKLQEWLRDNYNIHIVIIPFAVDSYDENSGYLYYYYVNKGMFFEFINKEHEFGFIDYEEALEKGLKRALKLI